MNEHETSAPDDSNDPPRAAHLGGSRRAPLGPPPGREAGGRLPVLIQRPARSTPAASGLHPAAPSPGPAGPGGKGLEAGPDPAHRPRVGELVDRPGAQGAGQSPRAGAGLRDDARRPARARSPASGAGGPVLGQAGPALGLWRGAHEHQPQGLRPDRSGRGDRPRPDDLRRRDDGVGGPRGACGRCSRWPSSIP
jgi:hypothetical protein